MSELLNLMSGVSGVTVQARDIEGGLHFHFTVTEPLRSGVARQVELGQQATDSLATVLRDLDGCLAALGVPDADLPATVDHVTRAVLLQFRGEPYPVPQESQGTPIVATLRRLVSDIAAYVEPERLLTRRFYFSTGKVIAAYRAYQQHLNDERPLTPEQRFLALYEYFRARNRLLFGPARLLPGNPPPDDDQWVYFTGTFVLTRDDEALDRVPGAREKLGSGRQTSLNGIVTTVFGDGDPFFYPYVEFRGEVAARAAAMTMSRKHLVLTSRTVGGLAAALSGAPVAFAGFGTVAPTDSDVMQIHPILF